MFYGTVPGTVSAWGVWAATRGARRRIATPAPLIVVLRPGGFGVHVGLGTNRAPTEVHQAGNPHDRGVEDRPDQIHKISLDPRRGRLSG